MVGVAGFSARRVLGERVGGGVKAKQNGFWEGG